MRLSPQLTEACLALASPTPVRPASPGRWTITIIGWHPVSVNRLLSTHPMKRSKLKRADAEIIAVEARQAGIPKATGRRRVSVRLIVANPSHAQDPDNTSKSLRDGLKTAGLIVDDSAAWSTFTEAEIEIGRKATIIEIEDVS